MMTKGKNGQPQAQDLEHIPGTPAFYTEDNKNAALKGLKPPSGLLTPKPLAGGATSSMQGLGNIGVKRSFTGEEKVEKAPHDPNAVRYNGIIKQIRPDRKFGFIESPELFSLYGRDTFVSGVELGSFGTGQSVTFAHITNDQGQPQAQDLQDAGANAGMSVLRRGPFAQAGSRSHGWDDSSTGGLAPEGKTHGWDPSMVQGVMPDGGANLMNLMEGSDERHIGIVTKLAPGKPYGFIQCAALRDKYGTDVFVSGAHMGSFENGQEVSFSYELKNGKPQGINLQPSDGSGGSWQDPMQQAQTEFHGYEDQLSKGFEAAQQYMMQQGGW
jgi:cold shock CspA family protein